MKRQLFSATSEASPQDCAQCGKKMIFGVIRVVTVDEVDYRTCGQKCESELLEAKEVGNVGCKTSEHLKELELERTRGTASGIYYKGVGAVMNPGYILIARDMSALRKLWGRLTEVPLNENEVYPLAAFAQKNCTET